MFKIEKGVPINTRSPRAIYPFPEMKVGDSFHVPISGAQDRKRATLVRNAVHTWGKRHGCRFTTRTDDNGMRVWRVK